MSLRHYLFALIGTLILLLTLAQLVLVYWIDKNLTAEVNQQAQKLSEKVVEFAFSDIHANSEAKIVRVPNGNSDTRMIVIPTTSNVKKDAKESDTENTAENVKVIHEVIEIEQDSDEFVTNEGKVIIKKRLAKVFEKLKENQQSANTNHTVKHVSMPNQFWFEHTVETSKSSELIRSIQLMILLCGGVALGFAYWLSIQFNKPLTTLKKGFEALAKGDYQYRITPHGVADIKATMNQFNHMLETLAKFTEAEKHYKEIAHLAELGEVSRGLAHTLRNPIHTIGLSIEKLNNNHLNDEERAAIIQTIQSKITHIDNNIKSLLTLTTTGISRTEQVPILAVVQDIILEYKFAQPKPQSFEVNISPELKVTGAESEVRSILHTLIINACEANPEQAKVIISATETGNDVQITVVDQGTGLSEEISRQLFQPHISSKPEGAGMGLYIAKRIISLHYHGDINLRNGTEGGCIAQAKFVQTATEPELGERQ